MATTVIGASMVLEGDILGEDSVVVLGNVRGRVSVREELTVESSGTLEAEVHAEKTVVHGRLTGQIYADSKVEIGAKGQIEGDIRAPRVLMADGARFSGHIDMA